MNNPNWITLERDELRAALKAAQALNDELVAALLYVLDCADRDDFTDLQPVREAIAKAVQS